MTGPELPEAETMQPRDADRGLILSAWAAVLCLGAGFWVLVIAAVAHWAGVLS